MNARIVFYVSLLAASAGLSGCQLAPTRIPDPPRTLELLSAEPLRIDSGCEVEGTLLVEYTVLQNGRTGNIDVSAGPECARQALIAWIASYRYAPPPADTPTRFEWMLVSAKRGS
jgi:hypothetical protein